MNGPAHPPVDSLADHHEGLLTEPDAAAVQSHLTGCSHCRALLGQLDEVSAILANEGRRPVSMPDAVAARLERAISQTAAQRAGHHDSPVVSLPHRRTSGAGSRSGSRRMWPLLAAAAAVVVASAIGIQVIGDDAGPEMSTASDRSSGGAAQPEAGSEDANNGAVPSEAPGVGKQPPTFERQDTVQLVTLARDLVAGETEPVPLAAACAPPSSAPGPVSLIRWQGSPAVLLVDEPQRRLVVLDCATAREELFATGF